MGSSYLILHGLSNYREPEHWQFWLAAQLAARGDQVLYPSLPEPDSPVFEEWNRVLRESLAMLNGGERVVVCHSLSCLLWFRSAASLADAERVDRLLLVSPPDSSLVPGEGADLRIEAFDPGAVRASVSGQIRIVCSDADPYNTAGAQELYATPLGIHAAVLAGAAHITPDSGFGPWPFAEAWCADAPS